MTDGLFLVEDASLLTFTVLPRRIVSLGFVLEETNVCELRVCKKKRTLFRVRIFSCAFFLFVLLSDRFSFEQIPDSIAKAAGRSYPTIGGHCIHWT